MTQLVKWIGIACILVALAIYSQAQQLPLMTADGLWLKLGTNTLVSGYARLYPVFDSVIMTASNAPSPVRAWADTEYSGTYPAWRAFDHGVSTYWNTTVSAYPHFIVYDCGAGNSSVVSTVYLHSFSNAAVNYGMNAITFDGSQDSNTWTQLIAANLLPATKQVITNSNTGYYRYFRLRGTTGYAGDGEAIYNEIELSSAGAANQVMTASNAPSPYASNADLDSPGLPSWRAFDYNYATEWQTPAGSNFPHWISYDFATSIVINGFAIQPATGAGNYGFKDYTFDGSADGSAWTRLDTGQMPNVSTNLGYTVNNTTAYRYYRIYGSNGWNATQASILELRFKQYK